MEQAHITEAPKKKSTPSRKHTSKGQKHTGNNARLTPKQKRRRRRRRKTSGGTQDRKKAKSSSSNKSQQNDDDRLKQAQEKPIHKQTSSKNAETKMPETQKTATANTGNLQNGKDESKHDTFDQRASQNGQKGSDAGTSKSAPSNSHPTSTEGVYVAKVGDDIYSVAKKFGISPETLRALNGLDPENSEDEIEAGEEYIIHVPGMRPTPTSTTSKRSIRSQKLMIKARKRTILLQSLVKSVKIHALMQMMDPVMMVEKVPSIHRASLAQTVQIVGLGQEKAAHLA